MQWPDVAAFLRSSVLPAAIERDVLVAFSTDPQDKDKLPKATAAGRTVVVLRNVDDKYSPTHFEVDLSSWGGDLALPKKHHWSSYFIAGTKVGFPVTSSVLQNRFR